MNGSTNLPEGLIYVFVGPSGVGKDTIARIIRQCHNIPDVISHTTRTKRPGEVNGENYFFVTNEELDHLIESDQLVEWANFCGKRYGSSRDEVEGKLKKYGRAILCIEENGARSYKEKLGERAKIIFVTAGLNELEARMVERKDDPLIIAERLDIAQSQILRFLDIADYIVLNRDLDEAVNQVEAIMKLR